MKKTIFTAVCIAVLAAGIQSCSSEETIAASAAEQPAAQKSRIDAPEVKEFKEAWSSIMKQKNSEANKMADEAKQQQYKENVTTAAKKFLISSGIPEAELQNNTAEEAASIRLRAYRLLAEKTTPTNN